MEFNKMLLSLVLVNGVSGVCLAIDVNNVNDMVARFGGVGSDTKSLDQKQALELANKFVEKGNTDTFWVSSILRAQFSSDTTLNKIGDKNSTVFAPEQFDAMKDLLGSADRSARQTAFDRMKSSSPAVEAPAPAPAPSIGSGSGLAANRDAIKAEFTVVGLNLDANPGVALYDAISKQLVSSDVVKMALQNGLVNVADVGRNNQNALDAAVVFADAPEYVKAIIEGSSPSDLLRAAEHVDNNGRDLKAHLQAKNNEFIREGRQIGGRRDRRNSYQILKNNGLLSGLDLGW